MTPAQSRHDTDGTGFISRMRSPRSQGAEIHRSTAAPSSQHSTSAGGYHSHPVAASPPQARQARTTANTTNMWVR